jgi:hypothetical protein
MAWRSIHAFSVVTPQQRNYLNLGAPATTLGIGCKLLSELGRKPNGSCNLRIRGCRRPRHT